MMRVFQSKNCRQLLAAFLLLFPCLIWSQQIDLAKSYDAGVSAMEAGDFVGATKVIDEVIGKFEATGLKRYGPAFGHFYYLKAMVSIRQKKFAEAVPNLKICYENYANEGTKAKLMPNLFREQALFQWGMCEQAAGDHASAAAKFEKVLKEDPYREPRINRMAVEMNLAQCLIKTGKKEQGEEMLNKLLNLEGASESTIQDAFTLMAAGGLTGDGDTTMAMVQQHASSLFGSSGNREIMNPRLASLAADSLQKGNALQAIVWYNLMTPPSAEIADLETRKKRLAERRQMAQEQGRDDVLEKYDAAIAESDKQIEEKGKAHGNALLGMAAAHYQVGSLSAAYAIYRQLVENFPEYGDRAMVMNNLIVCSTNLQRWDEAFSYGNQFFDEFPNHELAVGVSRTLSEVVFLKGDYNLALKMAREAQKGLVKGAQERESLDFVAASSLFQLGQYPDAEILLQEFYDDFPNSPRRDTAMYYLATSKVRMSKWGEAIPIMDQFVEEFKESPFRPTALFLNALGYLILEDPHTALVKINHLLAQHPRAPEIPGAHNVKGDVLVALEDQYETIVASYLRAKAMGQQQKKDDVVAYALKQMITVASKAGQHETAIEHYDAFKERYSNTVWKGEATNAAIEPLVALGRVDEAKEILETLVVEMSEKPGGGFDGVFRNYTNFLAKQMKLDQQIEALDSFPNKGGAPALDAWLLMGQIEAFERADAEAHQPKIDQLFEAVQKLYLVSGKELSNYSLVRLARWHKEDKGEESEALSIYEWILRERPEGEALGYALIDTANLDFQSGDSQRIQIAKNKFNRVLSELDSPAMQEDAVLGLARIAMEAKEWPEAQGLWTQLVESPTFDKGRAEASFSYAVCLENQNQRNEALKVYIGVYANFPGKLDWSTKAWKRSAEILWNNGRNLDALKVLQDMLRRTKGLEHPGIDDAKATFFKMRDEYIAAQKK